MENVFVSAMEVSPQKTKNMKKKIGQKSQEDAKMNKFVCNWTAFISVSPQISQFIVNH